MQVARGGKRGKTAGRGGKGQTARAGNKRRPEWRDIIKKLPKLRGRGKNSNKTVKTNVQKPEVVNLRALEGTFNASDAINPLTLIEKGIVSTWSGKIPRIKILGEGVVSKAFKVSGCAISMSAKAAIEKAGGSVVIHAPIVTATKLAKPRDLSKATKPDTKSTEKLTEEVVPALKSAKSKKVEKSKTVATKSKPAKELKPSAKSATKTKK